MSLKPTSKMVNRLTFVVVPVMLIFIGYVVFHLFTVSVQDSAKYQTMANDNQFRSITVNANRGSIYDCNGKILAQSATVYTVAVDPAGIDALKP